MSCGSVGPPGSIDDALGSEALLASLTSIKVKRCQTERDALMPVHTPQTYCATNGKQMQTKGILAAVAAILAAPAIAQDDPGRPLRELCSERPGLTTAACTVDDGHIQAEVGGEWTLEKSEGAREDRVDVADILLRYGLGSTTEVQLGWTAYGYVRKRQAPGDIAVATGIGDVTFGLKQNLRHPAESDRGLAIAILPLVTIPSGASEVGDGDWSARLIVPASYKLDDTISVAISPEIDAAANDGRSGRHLSYGSAIGLQIQIVEGVRISPEMQILRDNDPDNQSTQVSASFSCGMQVSRASQFDLQTVVGLNRDTPDFRILAGYTRKL